ncbi:PH domain-containing protein [Gandjariella thermophila]|uniref:PH domain-containing protein n=1 Tax=Gandjariella thermophila TaxID=1931992 RepID=UPI001CEFA682|nr:PH domain-containing protein [Gandjariella thermophila]
MQQRTWSPQPPLVALGWVLAAAALGWLVATPDPAGRLMAGVAAAALGLAALYGTVARPCLVADADGVEVRGLHGGRRWAWPQLDVRVVRVRRLGREVALLELDGYDRDGVERLAVLGRLELGAHPEEVADELSALRR